MMHCFQLLLAFKFNLRRYEQVAGGGGGLE
jgi:hypothetical protein